MIVGDNSRAEDIDVNAVKEKQQTNVRAAAADQTVRLVPAKRLSLEEAIEFVREDECVEITPGSVPCGSRSGRRVARWRCGTWACWSRPFADPRRR
jgi:predicted membrane GTPase involved in stress response